ncbi:2-oxoacid:acceptor oxidoreductase family protein [Thermoproteota archaeon]
MQEVRWHGRGGQGVVTASQLLARSAMREGKYIQAFPEFGPERMGAPIKAYTRISNQPINIHSGISFPDIVIVLDPTLVGHVDFGSGLTDDGLIIVNTNLNTESVIKAANLEGKKVIVIDATKVALETIGRNITNTAVMGALVKATGIVNLESVIKEIEESFGSKFNRKLIDNNIASAKRCYEELN